MHILRDQDIQLFCHKSSHSCQIWLNQGAANQPSDIFLGLLSGLESWGGVTWGWCYRGEWGGGTLSSKNSRGPSGVQRENTGTSFHNHNIGTTKCCPQTTIICHQDFGWKSKTPKEFMIVAAQSGWGTAKWKINWCLYLQSWKCSEIGQYDTTLRLCFFRPSSSWISIKSVSTSTFS